MNIEYMKSKLATPFYVGYFDGNDGAECDPLSYGFRTTVDCEQYVLGWREGAHIEDTDEMVSYREDVDWMRGGLLT